MIPRSGHPVAGNGVRKRATYLIFDMHTRTYYTGFITHTREGRHLDTGPRNEAHQFPSRPAARAWLVENIDNPSPRDYWIEKKPD